MKPKIRYRIDSENYINEKAFISVEQLKELDENQQYYLRKLWKPEIGNYAYWPEKDSVEFLINIIDWDNIKRMNFLPLFDTEQCKELLIRLTDKVLVIDKVELPPIQRGFETDEGGEGYRVNDTFEAFQLIDALWGALCYEL